MHISIDVKNPVFSSYEVWLQIAGEPAGVY